MVPHFHHSKREYIYLNFIQVKRKIKDIFGSFLKSYEPLDINDFDVSMTVTN